MKTYQSEAELETLFISQLEGMGYARVIARNEADLLLNLKKQLEKHNNIELSESEFARIVNILNKGSVFEKAGRLREYKQQIILDNGKSKHIGLLNTHDWCRNEFQVTSQITMEGTYKTRYDVTILINGLPLVQIELKRRGLELKEAFNQTQRYQKHSYSAGNALFHYIQLFIITNGVNTKYFSNNKEQSFKQTFHWTDEENVPLNNILNGFTSEFLEPCHLSKMICKYIVLNSEKKIPMVLRPYQFYAVEKIVKQVQNSTQGGYIWHTTGSGKTLTAFKTSQLLKEIPEVKKVIFVVDRRDLDSQTTKEFNYYSAGSVDGTNNTRSLVKQLQDPSTKLIVTTIQKLNTAISNNHYVKAMESLRDQKVVFIFDECHRSQFGDTHHRIKSFFHGAQMFGFTGTPIFADNAVKNERGKRTTKELFGPCLHKYVITDAIKDENVLKFSVEYVGKMVQNEDSHIQQDIKVADINRTEILNSEKRIGSIVDYILANHNRKTADREFNAMMCVNSVESLKLYYQAFKHQQREAPRPLTIATIFSYTANEDSMDANGFIPDDLDLDSTNLDVQHQHTRDVLESYIQEYNSTFGTEFTTKDSDSFYRYYNDIADKVKKNKIDILLVVNMFLTGFDSPLLNTIYVDKNLQYHGLIQAFSRTNRILNEKKSQGNVVVFRNLKEATDQAVILFSNKEAIDTILMEPYEDYIGIFNRAYETLYSIVITPDQVDTLVSEEQKLAFVKAFRELMRVKNIMSSFANFEWSDVACESQLFEDFKSKYLDIYDQVASDTRKETVSVLSDIDFELELIQQDEINVAYIIDLIITSIPKDGAMSSQIRSEIMQLMSNQVKLRSKKHLIEEFIDNQLPNIKNLSAVEAEFNIFWQEKQDQFLEEFAIDTSLTKESVNTLITSYGFDERLPDQNKVLDLIQGPKPKALERAPVYGMVCEKLITYETTFVDGLGGKR
jgi:type I restriction enzyme, R subunit